MIHSNNDGTTSLTNIYFEEILPDDISDADDHKQGNIKTMSKPIQTKSEPNISNHSISNKIKNENEWKINHLSKCTQTTIGGGTSLTLIHSNDSKLANIYISFGGCDRNGNISNSVNMYNPSKSFVPFFKNRILFLVFVLRFHTFKYLFLTSLYKVPIHGSKMFLVQECLHLLDMVIPLYPFRIICTYLVVRVYGTNMMISVPAKIY